MLDDEFLKALGVDSYDDLHNQAIDKLASHAEQWMGDTPNDVLARAIIATVRPLLDGLLTATEADLNAEANPMLVAVLMRQFMSSMESLRCLEALAAMRGRNE